MRRRREVTEVFLDIKNAMPNFDKDKLLEYTKTAIPHLYNALKENNKQEIKVKCKEELIDKLLKEKDKYKISNDIDHVNVQHAQLFDYNKNTNEIQVYTSIYFYDRVGEDGSYKNINNNYWDDIWIITYKPNNESQTQQGGNCINCGAVMEYNPKTQIFKCEYCGNTICNNLDADWEIVDIEINEYNHFWNRGKNFTQFYKSKHIKRYFFYN